MKKRTAIITIICIGILSVSVAALAGSETISSAVGQLLGIEEQAKEPVQLINNEVQQLSVEARASQITQQLTNRDFISLLESKGYYIDEINAAMEDYIRLSALFDITDAQAAQLYQLVEDGYDFKKLLDVFSFAQDTDHPRDVGYAKQIYDEAEAIRVRGDNWIENAFNSLTQTRGGVLNEGQIQQYMKQGITINEIGTANIMSRKGTRTITQILDSKLSGKTWAEVAEEVYGTRGFNANDYVQITDLGEIYTRVALSEVTGIGINEAASDEQLGNTRLAEKFQAASTAQKALEIPAQITDEVLETAQEKLPSMDSETIKSKLEEGKTIRQLEAEQTRVQNRASSPSNEQE